MKQRRQAKWKNSVKICNVCRSRPVSFMAGGDRSLAHSNTTSSCPTAWSRFTFHWLLSGGLRFSSACRRHWAAASLAQTARRTRRLRRGRDARGRRQSLRTADQAWLSNAPRGKHRTKTVICFLKSFVPATPGERAEQKWKDQSRVLLFASTAPHRHQHSSAGLCSLKCRSEGEQKILEGVERWEKEEESQKQSSMHKVGKKKEH